MSYEVYNIPAGIPFIETLAGGILKEYGHNGELPAKIRILVPNRRVCRLLTEAFLDKNHGEPLLLPLIKPLGDIDTEEMELTDITASPELQEIPPAISSYERNMILARLVMEQPHYKNNHAQAIMIAGALGKFLDHMYIDGIEFDGLADIVPEEFASHWQLTLDFLKILGVHWKNILQDRQVIDQADRRNKILRLQAKLWEKTPPKERIIVAGSTGSVPASADLINTVMHMDKGCVILPGLDKEMNDTQWNEIEESHPQFMLKKLLSRFNIERCDVENWKYIDPNLIKETYPRRYLIREIMRPAMVTDGWSSELDYDLLSHSGIENKKVILCECENKQEEATVIALALRGALERHKTFTASLVTPDRNLVKSVINICKRWNIDIDYSGGKLLCDTDCGSFFRLVGDLCMNGFRPSALLELLKTSIMKKQAENELYENIISDFEIKYLRGIIRYNSPEQLSDLLHNNNETEIYEIFNHVQKSCKPLLNMIASGKHNISDWVKAHVESIENLVAGNESSLWSGDSGRSLSEHIAQIIENEDFLTKTDIVSYMEVTDVLISNISVRSSANKHPRLRILGTMEARLVQSDLVILGGLNEGIWPQDSYHDPWMSRQMKLDFGLSSPERKTGQTAHDFVQCFCAKEVIMTRSKRLDNSPSVPSSWLQRLEAVTGAANLNIKDNRLIAYAQHIRKPEIASQSVLRPQPNPPLHARPKRISATNIETWINDPYSIYAKYILKLRKIDDLEKEADNALLGTILHKVMERFVKIYDRRIPVEEKKKATNLILDFAREELLKNGFSEDSSDLLFQMQRIDNMAKWAIENELSWRNTAIPIAMEAKGKMSFETACGSFELNCIADRIDIDNNDNLIIIDYKTGGSYSVNRIQTADLPQMPLEALIAENGGFDLLKSHNKVRSMAYWVISGSKNKSSVTMISDEKATQAIHNAHEGLKRLLDIYSREDAVYTSLPYNNTPRFNDYIHLARVKEWLIPDEDHDN